MAFSLVSALDLELIASNTEYEAPSDTQNALNELFDADRWMIIQDTQASTLRWDLVRSNLSSLDSRLTYCIGFSQQSDA